MNIDLRPTQLDDGRFCEVLAFDLPDNIEDGRYHAQIEWSVKTPDRLRLILYFDDCTCTSETKIRKTKTAWEARFTRWRQYDPRTAVSAHRPVVSESLN